MPEEGLETHSPQTLEDAIISTLREARKTGASDEAIKEATTKLGTQFSVSADVLGKAMDSETVKSAIYKDHGYEYKTAAEGQGRGPAETETKSNAMISETLITETSTTPETPSPPSLDTSVS